MEETFKNIVFDDRERAEHRLAALLEPQRPGLAVNLTSALTEASDPGTVLVQLERFLEASPNPTDELDYMAATPRYTRLLCTLFDQSHFLTDILCRHPEYLRWLYDDARLRRARSREEMIADLSGQVEGCDSPAMHGALMRRFKQREILRIATRDIFMHAPLASVTEDLSNFADASLEVALRVSYPTLSERFGQPTAEEASDKGPDVSFSIIALGKLGGRELNFSSDVDLLFLYSDEGETTGGREPALSNVEFFQKLGEQIINLVSEQTDEGHVFRVDMRLRPHGRLSPLTSGLDAAINYYSEYGQAWERQALIKARPVAGDVALGQAFLERTRPFVFPRYFDDETLEDIREIKQQMEAQIATRGETETDVKLGRGGIRDIEFTVQILQMLNGGRMPEFRTANTLDAIRALGIRGLLRAFEATSLASNYTFLRRVEHRLQIEGGRQRHVLPAASCDLDRLARRLGYASSESFLAEYTERTEGTRAILNQFLLTEGAGHLWTYDLLSLQAEGRIGMARLAEYGFKDPEKARNELILLSAGPANEPYPFHVRQQFAEIAPTLIEALAACADPDGTLIRLSRILTNLRAPGAIYGTLKSNPALCQYLVTLVANSEYLSEILIRDPGLFDVFDSRDALTVPHSREELERELENLCRAYDPDAAPYRLRDGEVLRVGLRELFCGATVVEVGQELTQLAEVCLAHALEKARAETIERYGGARGAFAILGLGRLGGREMGYGSDLDLVFVYVADAMTDSGMAASEYFAALAASTMRRLKEPTRYGFLYPIDARLRPDGNKGVLAVNHRRLEEYYRDEAQPWERLALVKVRAVAGDPDFGRTVEERARKVAFALPLTSTTLGRIEDIRRKIVRGATPLDLKKDQGGIAEIEFAVRLLQVAHAAETPGLERGDALGALQILARHARISTADAQTLREAYLLFRTIENRIRMMHGRATSSLPEDSAAQAELAQRLAIRGDLIHIIAEHKNKVHEIYLRIMTSNPSRV